MRLTLYLVEPQQKYLQALGVAGPMASETEELTGVPIDVCRLMYVAG